MLTYSFDDRGMDFLYEHLYKEIKNDILMGNLKAHEKLPSKRALAAHLNVSVVTVENAYSQLLAEGYIYSKPKSGFYVCDVKAEDVKAKYESGVLTVLIPKKEPKKIVSGTSVIVE